MNEWPCSNDILIAKQEVALICFEGRSPLTPSVRFQLKWKEEMEELTDLPSKEDQVSKGLES